MHGALGSLNVVVWAWAWIGLRSSPAFLAYSFGLRHAMDGDHIAAIELADARLH
jgi:high-affinity nickel-transport protein